MRQAAWVLGVALLAGACSEPRVESRQLALEAYCEASVVGVGLVEVETDYLPHVITCENGAASFEALEIQAIAARSYLYYKLDRSGEITDGTGDQVYTCGREPSIEHQMAVDATSGQVLQYMGIQVAAFYVAGALQNPPTCIAGPDDPSNTERYVTYNLGKAGDQIDQTILGFVDPSNYANRGCMSQNGSDCLADEGFDAEYMVRFYYGEDIELVSAEGPCILGAAGPDGGVGGVDAGTDEPDSGGAGGDGEVGGGCGVASNSSLAASLLLVLLLLARRRVWLLLLALRAATNSALAA